MILSRVMKYCLLFLFALLSTAIRAQEFYLQRESDSLSWLCLKQGDAVSRWWLPYPVYRLQAGDVNGDGLDEAMVGVFKATRYYPPGRRLFIFKNVRGKVRPMWMGSKLGGMLEDFRFVSGCVRSLETTTNGQYVVAEYAWSDFGLRFVRFVATGLARPEAMAIFEKD